MSLGSPQDNFDWDDYAINTPTFQLTPVEKPDMSPFLFHMTGKNEIINIIRQGEDGFGYLRASVPENQGFQQYQAAVICFTESPTFALDFFRYIRILERRK